MHQRRTPPVSAMVDDATARLTSIHVVKGWSKRHHRSRKDPLLFTAAALVTETGGMISHVTTVAREHGIPAVVGAWMA
ncbi:PEP-utilizing enzyme [Actinomycetes bacterium KLBMP 9759]